MRGDQLARQWQLIQRLARSRAGCGLDELADDLGCVRRTVYRDLDALMYAGFPVVSEKREGRSYYRFLESFRIGAEQLKRRVGGDAAAQPRTSADLSLKVVGIGVAGVALVLAGVPQVFGVVGSFPIRLVAAILVVIFAFFFVTVSSRIVGLVGMTSNPTSGMTIATLLGTSAIFLLFGWTDLPGKATALMVGTAVCIAASIAASSASPQ